MATTRHYDLKFVRLQQGSEGDWHRPEGGWYRELPDARIEVMSHARLQQVPLGDSDPEQKAREVVADMINQQKG